MAFNDSKKISACKEIYTGGNAVLMEYSLENTAHFCFALSILSCLKDYY